MDVGIIDEYGAWLHRYPFPRFTDPTERIPSIEELSYGDDDGGGGHYGRITG